MISLFPNHFSPIAGVSKTFQLGDVNEFGVMRKVVPMTNELVENKITCFEVNGTAGSKVGAQSVLPDATQFQVMEEIMLSSPPN